MTCAKCGSQASVKNGRHLGVQRWKCKDCGYQYTREQPRGRPAREKRLAVALYLQGLSMNAIGKLLKVSTPSVLRWVRSLAEAAYTKPAPATAAVVELDEMWHFLTSKKTNAGSGRLIVALPVDSWTGNVGVVIAPR